MHRTALQYVLTFFNIALWLLVSYSICSGQETSTTMHFDQLTIKDGLSHNSVRCLLQDHHGYIWIGTQNGLNKYDGYEFEIFKSSGNENTKLGFTGKNVTSLFEDSQKNLWIGTAKNGINFKASNSDKFINLHKDSAFAPIRDNTISSIFEDSDQVIWIATIGGGILKYDPKTKASKHYNSENSGLSSDLVFDIIQGSDGVIWAASGGTGLNFLKDNDQFEHFQPTLPDGSNMNGFRKAMHIDKDNLWLATEGTGLYQIDLISKEIKRFSNDVPNSISSNAILDVLKTKDGKLFLATDGTGLNLLDPSTQKTHYFNHQHNDIQALNSNSLACLLEDRSGNIWIGTYNGGLNIYKPNKTWFDLIFPPYTYGDQLKNRSILSVAEDHKGGIYIGTDGGGLNYIKPDTEGEFFNFKADPNNTNSISGNVVKSIYEDNKNQIWLGIFSEQTVIFNSQSRSFKRFPEAANVWSIDGNSSGEICLGTIGQGLKIHNSNNKKTYSFTHDPNNKNGLSSNLIMDVMYDNSDRLWVGTADAGIDIYNPTTKSFINYKHNSNDSLSLSSNEVRAVFQSLNGDIWIGTEDGGLNKWIGEGKFEHIGEEQGLIANSVMGICEDKDEMLWITTYLGISKYNPVNKSIQNFDFRTSQNLNQFNQMSILATKENRLYFGGTNGLHSIRPEEVKRQSTEINILFTNLEVSNEDISVGPLENGQIILKAPIESASKIDLSYIDNSFSISFSAIDFTNNNENVYEYKMDGFDDSWQITKPNQHSVSYTNLDPGQYIFKVKYRGNESSIQIEIKPPFWQTFIFKFSATVLILTILIGSLLFLIRRRDANYKRQMLRLEKEKLETSIEAKNSKLMFFAIQMAHKNEILSNIKNELKAVSELNGNKTGKLVNKLDRELKNENYWEDFNLYFNRVDQHFVKSIQKEYPNLTSNDIRMCSLIRMNLSNKEIASLCNISSRGVEQSKYRLKKRLGLDKDEDLPRFISLYNSQK